MKIMNPKNSKNQKNKKKRSAGLRLCAVVLLAVFAMAALTGCRDSVAFTRPVYNQQATETVNGNMYENEEDNEEERDDIWSVDEQDEADKERDYDRTNAQYGEGTDGEAYNVIYNADADALYTSGSTTDPDESSQDEGIDTTSGDTENEGESDTSSGEGEGEDDGSSGDGDTTADAVGDGDGTGTGDGTGSGDEENDSTEVDKNAETTEIPTGNTAAALGDIAVMVQMLGGDGVLVATSKDFDTAIVSGVKASTVFADELSDDLVYLGDIDSFSEITSANFSKLLKAEPDLVFMAEGDSFTSAQEKKLTSAGIKTVYMDDMTEGDSSSDTAGDHLLYNLDVIAGALEDRTEYGGENPEDVVSDYESWYNDIIKAAKTDSTLYSCYFASYDEDVTATYTYQSRKKSFTGLPIAESGKYLAFGTYASSAGVTMTNAYNKCFGWFSNSNQASLIYFQPYRGGIGKSASGGLYSSGKIGFFTGNGTADKNTNPYPLSMVSSSIFLGNDSYPAILTGSQYITDTIKDSRDNNGIFGNKYDAEWFRYSTGDEIITIETTSYKVYTVPYGITDWTDGCVESPLFTSWVSAKFYDTYTDAELIDQIREFYETFFRYDLSDSAAKKILQGREE